MKNIFIVTPVANEEDTIEKSLKDILDLNIPNLCIVPVIDKYSKDQTKTIIEAVQKENSRVRLLDHKDSTGAVSCYLYGFKYALENGADYIIEMDSGGSHDPKEIPNFIRFLEQGYDCVFGSRFLKGAGITNHAIYRRLLSRGGTILANLVLGTKLSDMTSGYEAFKRNVLERVGLDNFLSANMTHFYQTEMRYYCSQLQICEIPIIYKGSKSGLKFATIFKCLKTLFTLKERKKLER